VKADHLALRGLAGAFRDDFAAASFSCSPKRFEEKTGIVSSQARSRSSSSRQPIHHTSLV